MFHLQMAVLNLLFRAHMGHAHDIGSLERWFIVLKRDSNIFGTGQRRSVKNFRACNRLFNHVLDGHILALIATSVGAKSCAELCNTLESLDWPATLESLQSEFDKHDLVGNLRMSPERDVVYENGLLFLQHGLVYRNFGDAMRHGDCGRIKYCLTYFMLWFQGSQFTNYAGELLHLIACLDHIWSPSFREYWYNTALVNLSGSKKGFMAVDLLGELVVREIKSWITSTMSGASGEYLRTVMARQVLLCSGIRDSISREIGCTNYYKHSSNVNPWFDVRTVCDMLIRDRAFIFTTNRVPVKPEKVPSEVVDLYTRGLQLIWTGKGIDTYVEKERKRRHHTGNLVEGTSEDVTQEELEIADFILDEDDDFLLADL